MSLYIDNKFSVLTESVGDPFNPDKIPIRKKKIPKTKTETSSRVSPEIEASLQASLQTNSEVIEQFAKSTRISQEMKNFAINPDILEQFKKSPRLSPESKNFTPGLLSSSDLDLRITDDFERPSSSDSSLHNSDIVQPVPTKKVNILDSMIIDYQSDSSTEKDKQEVTIFPAAPIYPAPHVSSPFMIYPYKGHYPIYNKYNYLNNSFNPNYNIHPPLFYSSPGVNFSSTYSSESNPTTGFNMNDIKKDEKPNYIFHATPTPLFNPILKSNTNNETFSQRIDHFGSNPQIDESVTFIKFPDYRKRIIQTRGGIIPYTIVNGKVQICAGIHTTSGDITDFGGRLNHGENAIDAAIREFDEETLNVFQDFQIKDEHIRNSFILLSNSILIIFLKIDCDFAQKREQFLTERNNVKVSEIKDFYIDTFENIFLEISKKEKSKIVIYDIVNNLLLSAFHEYGDLSFYLL